MNSRVFLRAWEQLSGIRLIGEGKARFLRDCQGVLHLEPKHLICALKTASRTGLFDLRYIEAVALNSRCGSYRRCGDGKVVDFAKAARRRKRMF